MDTRLAMLRQSNRLTTHPQIARKRRLLIEIFKRQTHGYLYAQHCSASPLESSERPKGVLIKYRELLRTAGRDEATLTKLNPTSDFGAEQARKEIHELISNQPFLILVAPEKTHCRPWATRRPCSGEWSSFRRDWRTGLFAKTNSRA